jgi:ubiquinone/menaquinone biosynthesis C-methylase UbiE
VTATRDRWASWLLERRYGGDSEWREKTLEQLSPIRDRVLENAAVGEGDVVLDVGAGDGLIGFAALDRVGARGRVIFADISTDLLARCCEIAEELSVADRCTFAEASAADLRPIEDGSVDVVTTRSVLIYVEDKRAALREFWRVLRPGGRISLFEPINRFGYPEPPHRFWGYDVSAVQSLADKLRAFFVQLSRESGESTMFDFDERDLLAWAEQAGFSEIHLDYQAEIVPRPPLEGISWEAFLRFSGNPFEPTVEEVLSETLTPAEQEVFVRHLRPLVKRSDGVSRGAMAYLRALK